MQLAPDGSYPLDALLPGVLKETRVTQHMTGLQLTNPALKGNGGGQPQRQQPDKSQSEKRFANQLENLKNENKKLRAGKSNNYNNDKGGGKGKKSKGSKGWGDNSKGDRMPLELVGLERTWKGVPICFGYNCRSGCSMPPQNGGCKKGKHVCAKPTCGSPHPAYECNQ